MKITGFGYTNSASGTPTAGIVTGVAVYTATLHNYGGAIATLTASSLNVTTNSVGGTLVCAPAVPLALTGTIAAGADSATFTTTCTYTTLDDGSMVTANLNVSYSLNGLTRVASGSPATIVFTVQAD